MVSQDPSQNTGTYLWAVASSFWFSYWLLVYEGIRYVYTDRVLFTLCLLRLL